MKGILIFLLVITWQLNAQDSLQTEDSYSLPFSNPKPYEVGYMMIGLNSNDSFYFVSSGEPNFEYLNGILARYRYQKISIRFHASYIARKTQRTYYLNSTQDFGHSLAKDYKIGTGLQYSFLKKQDYIYLFFDVSYHKRVTTADFNNSQTTYQINLVSKLNGINAIQGIGSKIKLIRNLYVSFEAGYNYTYLIGKNKYNSYSFDAPEKVNATLAYYNLFAKLYLSLTF
jgi:hypothetical protein